ncbi:partitioning defective 3-like B-like isoform X1 [Solea senegalensis]|uniref:Partitioning defective 3-like B-like isoform X1 n=1 Tax=Solea senegalensis TaxID=28829 RepID=A0AAV6RD30_SOLSE|nr:partitioning defective 3-like B-like isoform X1 [Solea senegalensis]
MKVTVTFGDTAVVVPCKTTWTVRDLSDQATRRYRRILEHVQHGDPAVKTHHLEYAEGGILDMDDLLSDLVEDRDKLVAVFGRVEPGRTDSPREDTSNYSSPAPSPAPSPEPLHYYSHLHFLEPTSGEIEVNEAVLKANTPLLVRSSSDSALVPPHETAHTWTPEDHGTRSPEVEINHVLKGALERLRTDDDSPPRMNKVNFSTLTRTMEFPADRGPLGIHVVPYCSSLSGRSLGLHIKGIEENSRSKKEDLFKEGESIVQINDTPLEDKSFAESQEVFRQAMTSSSSSHVRLEVLPVANKLRYEKSLIGQLFTGDIKDPASKTKSPLLVRALQPEPKPEPKPDSKLSQEVRRPGARSRPPDPAPVELQPGPSSLDRVSPAPPTRAASSSPQPRTRSQSPASSKSPVSPSLPNISGKKPGRRIKIDLKKGAEGLGFTVVTRDSSVHGPGPILVKNILPRGAAIKDGRLQPGDRILEVHSAVAWTWRPQSGVGGHAARKQGESVFVLVSRQDDVFLPRELDGRLSGNDQLIAVNGESLCGRSNHAAMETLRRSMSSEGNARGTIQLVVLRAPAQRGSDVSTSNTGTDTSTTHQSHQSNSHAGFSNQERKSHDVYHKTPRSANFDFPTTSNNYSQSNDRAPYPTATTNGSYGHYGNEDEDLGTGFPPPPSPGTVEEMNRDSSPTPTHHRREPQMPSNVAAPVYRQRANDRDNRPRNRESKSMDMVADESNIGSLAARKKEPSGGAALGPTLGLWKSSSLESLQTAVSEAKQSHKQAHVPFHRPRPHMVRGRGCNQSFRTAIDKSYDGPSEDDDDLSEQSSGHETPASTSSRQGLDVEDDKQSKTKGKKKKDKKGKGKKKGSDGSLEDLDKKTKKKGFGLLRFGKKKDERSKDAAKAAKSKLEALSEEELNHRVPDNRDGYDPRYAEVRSGHAPPDTGSFPDLADDDSDPNYARIDHFRQPPSPQALASRTPSPAAAAAAAAAASGPHVAQVSAEELDGLYAKVNKPRPHLQNQQNQQANSSDQHFQGVRQDYPRSRAAPVYEDLDAARRRLLENDPNRVSVFTDRRLYRE